MSPADITRLSVQLEAINEKLGRIEDEVRATNGRVREIEGWRQRMVGAIAVAAVVIPVLSGLVASAVIS
jgi:ribosomal 50S subunit-associated protein YjgA (DUF615 family)